MSEPACAECERVTREANALVELVLSELHCECDTRGPTLICAQRVALQPSSKSEVACEVT